MLFIIGQTQMAIPFIDWNTKNIEENWYLIGKLLKLNDITLSEYILETLNKPCYIFPLVIFYM